MEIQDTTLETLTGADSFILELVEDQLPAGLLEVLVDLEDGDIIWPTEEMEKSIFRALNVFGRILQRFKGLTGNWITTRGGARVFVKAKTVINADKGMAKVDITLVSESFNRLPRAFTRDVKVLRITNDIGDAPAGRAVFGTWNSGSKTMTVYLQNIKDSRKFKTMPWNTTKDLTNAVDDVIYHEAGHSFYGQHLVDNLNTNERIARATATSGRFFDIQRTGARPRTSRIVRDKLMNFADSSIKEGGVTEYASDYRKAVDSEQVRGFLLGKRTAELTKIDALAIDDIFVNENFAETTMMWMRRERDLLSTTEWNTLTASHPGVVREFLKVAENLN